MKNFRRQLDRHFTWRNGLYCTSAAVILIIGGLLFFDDLIYRALLPWAQIAKDENSALGGFLMIVQICGMADCIAIFAMFIGASGRRREALAILTALIMVAAVVLPLKNTVRRLRPDSSERKSFPSGDTASISTVPLATQISPAATLGFGGLAGAVAVSRMFYQRHYFSDVIAGGYFGLLAGLGGFFLVRRGEKWLRFLRKKYPHWRGSKFLWLPPRKFFLCALAGILFAEYFANLRDWHNRIEQLVLFFGGALALQLAYRWCRVKWRTRTILVDRSKFWLTGGLWLMAVPLVGIWFVDFGAWRFPIFNAAFTGFFFIYRLRRLLAFHRYAAARGFMLIAAVLAIFWAIIYGISLNFYGGGGGGFSALLINLIIAPGGNR